MESQAPTSEVGELSQLLWLSILVKLSWAI
jgi:hypothetical protein